jgi:dTMP kinase
LITFEGPEGAGKTTQAARLVERLRRERRRVVCTREPGGTPTGEAIREILQHDRAGESPCPETEVLLFAASRAQLVRSVIRPALERGECVVCDRFADSTTVYQGHGRGFPVEQMLEINRFAVAGTEPDLTFLLDLDVRKGMQRLRSRHRREGKGPDRIEREALSFHERVRAGYLELAERFASRYRVLDADRPVGRLAEEIWESVADALR